MSNDQPTKKVVWPNDNLPPNTKQWTRNVQSSIENIYSKMDKLILDVDKSLKGLNINLGSTTRNTAKAQEAVEGLLEEQTLAKINASSTIFEVTNYTGPGTVEEIFNYSLPDPYVFEGSTTIRITCHAITSQTFLISGACSITGRSELFYTYEDTSIDNYLKTPTITANKPSGPLNTVALFTSDSLIITIGEIANTELTLKLQAIVDSRVNTYPKLTTRVEITNNVRLRAEPYVAPI